MRRRFRFPLAVAPVFFLTAAGLPQMNPAGGEAKPMQIGERFIGTWQPVSATDQLSNGQVGYPPYGQYPKGYLMYDATGHVSVQLMNPVRPTVDLNQASPEETQILAQTFLAYSGTYKVLEEESAVVHHVESSLNPADVGKDQKRQFELQGDQLILRIPPVEENGVIRNRTLVWKRVR